MSKHVINIEDEEKERETCLSCTRKECTGDYPYCQDRISTRKIKDKFACLEHGEAHMLVCLLVKIGLKRTEIAKICDTTSAKICAILRYGVKKGMITKEEYENSKSKKYTKSA